jgi:sialidase-1
VTVFDSGAGGYNTYRIPALVRASNGTLLAFAEGRRNSASDAGDIEIVLKRSTDGGANWGSLIVAQDEGTQTIGNPMPIVDEATGRIHLLFCRNNDRVFHSYSDDDGVSWTARKEITSAVKLPSWSWYATGPGHGIQLKRGNQAGRLVAASDHNTSTGQNGMQVVYSDDAGETWRLGATAAAAGGINPNENLAVELVAPAASGGSQLYFTVRDQGGSAPGTRAEVWSDDGGATYQLPVVNDTSLVMPVVQASVARLAAVDEGDSRNLLLLSGPNAGSRVNMSVWYSTDEAATWSTPKSVYAGSSAYSDMVPLGDGRMGLIFEKDNYGFFEFLPITPAFLGLTDEQSMTWTGTSAAAGWEAVANWSGSPTPAFTSAMGLVFGNATTHPIGGDRTARLLSFSDAADASFTIQLTDTAGAGRTLQLENAATDIGNRAAIRVAPGATGSFTLASGTVLMTDSVYIDHAGTGALTIASPISGGSSGLTKAGRGTLVLSGSSSFSGSIEVRGGVMRVGSGGTTGSLSGSSAIAIGSGGTFSHNRSNGVVAFANPISGQGTFRNDGTGEVGLTGSSSFSGTVIASTGKIAFQGANSEDGEPSVVVNNVVSIGSGFIGGIATFAGLSGTGRVDGAFGQGAGTRTLRITPQVATSSTFAGAIIDGTGGRVLALVKAGPLDLTLSGSGNAYSGGTTITGGRLRLSGGGNRLPAGGDVILGATGVLDLGGNAQTLGSLTGSGSVATGGGRLTLGAGNESFTFSAAVTGSGSLVKTGAGTLTVSAATLHTGSTTVEGGRLQMAHAAALAASRVVPLAGGTLTLASGLRTTVGGLAPAAGGLVDAGSGMVTVAAGLSPAALVTALMAGRGDGSWNGTGGITSSVAAADLAASIPRTVGWLDNGDGSVAFAYSAPGDTNLDWTLDILDAANFLAGGKFDSGLPAGWNEGDFGYDGIVDILDAADFLATSLFDAGPYNATQAAVAAVPEPTSLSAAAVLPWAAVWLAMRRRRHG